MSSLHLSVTSETFPLAEVFTISRGSRTRAEVLTASVTFAGITGRGECVPYSRFGETMESVKEQITSRPAEFDRQSLQERLAAGGARNAAHYAIWEFEEQCQPRRVRGL